MWSNTLKSVVYSVCSAMIDVNGNEHFFYMGKNGAMIHVAPFLGKCRLVWQSPNDNEYFTMHYSHLSGCYYFSGYPSMTNCLGEYNPVTGELKWHEIMYFAGAHTRNSGFMGALNYDFENYINSPSHDGHIWLGAYKYKGLYGACRFNVLTKTVDKAFPIPDREFNHIHGKWQVPCYFVDTAGYEGVYSYYLYDDNLDFIRPTILSEMASSGLSWSNEREIYLHYGDRSISSPTRRVLTVVNGTWRVVDIKSPSTFLNSQVSAGSSISGASWVNQSGTPISTSGWNFSATLADYDTYIGEDRPSFDCSYVYAQAINIGRHTFVGRYYMANKAYFFTFPIHPDTGEAIYPAEFNKQTTYLNNSFRIYKCNFGGDFGFSSDDEIVGFITDGGSNWGFIRPDTNVWVSYNVSTDPDNYIIRQVSESYTDPDYWGGLFDGRFGNVTEIEVGGSTWLTYNSAAFKSAVSANLIQEIDANKNLADITIKCLLDKTDINTEITFKSLEKVRTSAGVPTQTILLGDGEALVYGSIYSGVAGLEYTDRDIYTRTDYQSNSPISYNGAIRVSGQKKAIGFGYLGFNHITDASDINTVIINRVTVGDVTEPLYGCIHGDYFLFVGEKVRQTSVYGGGWMAANHIANLTSHNLTSLTHDKFDGSRANTIRSKYGLPNQGYTDEQVETQIQIYLTINPLASREDVIDEFLSGPEYKSYGIASDGTKIYLGGNDQGHVTLAGIRIETTPGSGVWVDQYSNRTYNYPIAFYANPSTLLGMTKSDWKVVQLQLSSKLGVMEMGRLGVTDTYVFWFEEITGSRKLWYTTKSAFETAATGDGILTDSDFESLTIPDALGDERFGGIGTHQSDFFRTVGDKVYLTVKENNNAVYVADFSADTLTLFATLADNSPKSIDILGNEMVISCNTNIYYIADYTAVSLPYTLV